jgi:hypothetical protein
MVNDDLNVVVGYCSIEFHDLFGIRTRWERLHLDMRMKMTSYALLLFDSFEGLEEPTIVAITRFTIGTGTALIGRKVEVGNIKHVVFSVHTTNHHKFLGLSVGRFHMKHKRSERFLRVYDDRELFSSSLNFCHFHFFNPL